MPHARGARLSHAVYFTSDVAAARDYYQAAFRRRFSRDRESGALRADCWFITERTREIERPGWTLYYATGELDALLERSRFDSVHLIEVDDTRFAFVDDALLGHFVLQEGGGGDAWASFFTKDAERALPRLDETLRLYVERGETIFATTSGAVVEVAPDEKVPRWVPAWPASKLTTVVSRAVKHGGRVVDVRSTLRTSVSILDPWGHWFVVTDLDAFAVDELPDLRTVEEAEAWTADESGRERAAAAADEARVAELRKRYMDPSRPPWLRGAL